MTQVLMPIEMKTGGACLLVCVCVCVCACVFRSAGCVLVASALPLCVCVCVYCATQVVKFVLPLYAGVEDTRRAYRHAKRAKHTHNTAQTPKAVTDSKQD